MATIDSSYNEGATLTLPARSNQESSQESSLEKLALVIPTLCEEENIGVLIDHVRSVLDPVGFPYEIVVVDDDSKDNTGAVVTAIAQKDPRVRLLVRKGQRGLSGAILYGWLNTDATIVGVMDADLQHPPELLSKLLASMRNGHDIAIGSRYIPGGELGAWNPFRKFVSAAAGMVTWPLQSSGCRAHDPMSGYFMVRRSCIEQVPFQKAGFKLLLEVLVRGRLHALEEVPFSFGLRNRGESKASIKVGWHYAQLLARLYAAKLGFGHRA